VAPPTSISQDPHWGGALIVPRWSLVLLFVAGGPLWTRVNGCMQALDHKDISAPDQIRRADLLFFTKNIHVSEIRISRFHSNGYFYTTYPDIYKLHVAYM